MEWYDVNWSWKIGLVVLGLLVFGAATYMVFYQGWSDWVFWAMLLALPLWIFFILSTSIQVKPGDGRFPGPGGDF